MSEALKAALLERAKREKARRAAPQADMSFTGRLKDNIFGVDDGVMSPGEKIGTALNTAGESMTLGVVGDEAAAAADSLVGRGNYNDRLQKYRSDESQFRRENPKTALAAEVAPALIPGIGAAGAIGKAPTIGKAAARAAGLGGASGAVYGFSEGEGGAGERAKNAASTAAFGALFGGAAGGGFAALARAPRGVQALFRKSEERPTVGVLRGLKNEAYRAVDRSGEVFTGDDTTKLYDKVRSIFDDSNYVEDVDNASRAVLNILERNSGKELTLGKLDKVRQGLWKRYNSAQDQPHILDAIHAVDEMIDSKAGTSELMDVARAANAKYSKAKLLDAAFQKADDQVASTGSGGNTFNKYRQVVTSIINDPKKARFFTEEEIAAMREFVHGTPSEGVLRLVGKMSPSGNGLMLTLHTIAGVSSGGATVPLMVVGEGSKRLADRSVRKGAERVKDVAAGYTRPQSPPMLTNVGPAGTSVAPVANDAQLEIRGQRRNRR